MDKTKVLVIAALLISICSFGKEISNIPGQASVDDENIPQSSGRPVQTPVSYTHLDVYKRQSQCNANHIERRKQQ